MVKKINNLPKKPRNIKRPPTEMDWETEQPKRQERIELYKKCKKCILVPPKKSQDKNDPKNYKFPICTKLEKSDGKCEYNCKGIVAANRRARLARKYPKIVELTRKLIEEWKCTKKSQKPTVEITKPKTMKPKAMKPKAIKPKKSGY